MRLVPVAGALRVEVQDREGKLHTTRGRYLHPNVVTVAGRAPADQVIRKRITVSDPARYTGHVLADAMQRAGMLNGNPKVSVATQAPSAEQRPSEVQLRRPIGDVITHTNKVSDNLGAEMLLRKLGTLQQPTTPLGPDSLRLGIAAITADLARLGADLLVSLLVDMHQRGGPGYELFRNSLPIGGVDGTLASRMKDSPAAGRVRAKTGTVSAVSNLAGYIETRSGRHLAFAIVCQNFAGSPSPWRDLQDRICAVLADM